MQSNNNNNNQNTIFNYQRNGNGSNKYNNIDAIVKNKNSLQLPKQQLMVNNYGGKSNLKNKSTITNTNRPTDDQEDKKVKNILNGKSIKKKSKFELKKEKFEIDIATYFGNIKNKKSYSGLDYKDADKLHRDDVAGIALKKVENKSDEKSIKKKSNFESKKKMLETHVATYFNYIKNKNVNAGLLENIKSLSINDEQLVASETQQQLDNSTNGAIEEFETQKFEVIPNHLEKSYEQSEATDFKLLDGSTNETVNERDIQQLEITPTHPVESYEQQKRKEQAAIKIQSLFRMVIQRSIYINVLKKEKIRNEAAIKIQSMVRMHIQRSAYIKELQIFRDQQQVKRTEATIQIQSLIRMYLQRCEFNIKLQYEQEQLSKKRNQAAIKIQALFRKYVQRSILKRNLQIKKEQLEQEERKRHQAAIKIQSLFRMHAQRSLFKIKLQEKKDQLEQLEFMKALQQEQEDRIRNEAAIKIQILFRMHIQRSSLKKKLIELKEKVAQQQQQLIEINNSLISEEDPSSLSSSSSLSSLSLSSSSSSAFEERPEEDLPRSQSLSTTSRISSFLSNNITTISTGLTIASVVFSIYNFRK